MRHPYDRSKQTGSMLRVRHKVVLFVRTLNATDQEDVLQAVVDAVEKAGISVTLCNIRTPRNVERAE